MYSKYIIIEMDKKECCICYGESKCEIMVIMHHAMS